MVCRRCGDEVFSDAVTATFERIRDGGMQPSGQVYSTVYDYKTLLPRIRVPVAVFYANVTFPHSSTGVYHPGDIIAGPGTIGVLVG